MDFDEIASFALGATGAPESAMEMAATLLIDTLGVAAGSTQLKMGRIVRDHAVRFQAAGGPEHCAHLLFDGRASSLTGASFGLASQIDNLDAHDGYNPNKGHIGCAVLPALFALAEHCPDLTGRAALEAYVVAYEIAARAGTTLHATVSDYHTSGAWNALGVAALGCRLRGQSADVLQHALGIAEYHGPRSQMMREIATPTMLHDGSGMGAMVGVMAALMAEDGFTGAPAITAEAPEAAAHWAGLGEVWTIEQNYIKPYPICRWAHGAIDALGLVMTEHDLGADEIAHVKASTFREGTKLFQGIPETTSQAQYSLPFALAVKMVHGGIKPHHIDGAGLTDPAVLAALAKIEVVESEEHNKAFPAARSADVVVTLKNGAQHASGFVDAHGGPQDPLTLREVEDKFFVMTEHLPRARAQALWNMRARLLEPDAKFSDLIELALPAA